MFQQHPQPETKYDEDFIFKKDSSNVIEKVNLIETRKLSRSLLSDALSSAFLFSVLLYFILTLIFSSGHPAWQLIWSVSLLSHKSVDSGKKISSLVTSTSSLDSWIVFIFLLWFSARLSSLKFVNIWNSSFDNTNLKRKSNLFKSFLRLV